jgi:NDP-sugar pyrophosphorylase family protein
MKAVILSAGQGKRLLPMTADRPKCILPVRGQTMIEWQIDELAKCGIDQVNVVPLTPCPTIWSAVGQPMMR